MGKGFNKEQAVFLVGTVLFAWVMLNLGLFLTEKGERPGKPMVAGADIQEGHPDIRELLSILPLTSYRDRSPRDPFFSHASIPPTFFVRSKVYHAFGRTNVLSRYAFECLMVPTPLREVRLQLPPGTRADHVFSRERDRRRPYGQDGRILVVPVKPQPVNRNCFRCQITVVLRGALSPPTEWAAPIVAFTEATANVSCESGYIALASPGDRVELLPPAVARPQTGLEQIDVHALPKELATHSTKFGYRYRRPEYALTVKVKARPTKVVGVHKPKPFVGPKVRPVVKPKVRPVVGPKLGPVVKPKPVVKKKLVIPGPDDGEALPFKVVAIVRIKDPEPRRQVVLRDRESKEFYHKFEGDTLPNGFRLQSVTDDAVILIDPEGKAHKIRGRFEDKYNE